jgi:ABC-type taurine transport system substrate-binding protein
VTDDVVEELDRYLADDETIGVTAMVQRARDEIVALRQRCALHEDLEFVSKNELTQARDEALEEAARVCDEHANRPTVHNDTTDRMAHAVVQQSIAAISCATAIRALKDDRDD